MFKIIFFRLYGGFKCVGYKTKCRGALDEIDKRILISDCMYFSTHCNEEYALKSISVNDLNIINENLKIRDFIIIGEKKFQQEIKDFENNFIDKKSIISYLEINELRGYLNNKKKMIFIESLIIL